LIIICVLLLLGERNYLADAPFFSVSSKGTKTTTYGNKKYTTAFTAVLITQIFVSVVLPFVVLFIQAFRNGSGQFFKAFDLLKPTFSTSFMLALIGALLTVFIAVVAVIGTKKNQKYFDMILLVTFATPSIILGISLIKFYNHPALNFIYSSFAMIIIGYTAKFSFIATKLISNAVKQLPPSLDEAAQIAGISKLSRIRNILLPLIKPAIFGAFIISFIFNIGELGTTIMVYPPGTEIMPIKVYTIMANAPQALTSSMTLIVFGVTLILIALFYFLSMSLIKHKHES
jgi:ABC-type Fe3+ transport system permease subunit